MPWSSKLTILTVGQRLNSENPSYDPVFERPRGTIVGVSPGNKFKKYGPNTDLAVLVVNGIPDAITPGEWRRLLLRDFRSPLDKKIIIKSRDVRVVFSELSAAQKANLNDPQVKEASIGYSTFLTKAHIERHARRLEENDLTNPDPD